MKVFYRPEQVARTSSFSPSALKPQLVVEDWLNRPELNVEVCSFEPVTAAQLMLAHDADFVRGVCWRARSRMALAMATPK